MQNNMLKKGLVIGIIVLFVGASVGPCISGNITKTINEDNKIEVIKDPSQLTYMNGDSPRDTDWWQMFHHDLNHSGYSTSAAPNTNDVLWGFTTGGWVSSSPAIVDGKVYVGSDDNKVYCLNANNGAKIWDYTTGDDVSSSPAVADGKVFIGSGYPIEHEGDTNIYCLNAVTGDKIWNYTTGRPVISCPAVANGKVYVGSWDYNVYCLDAETGVKIWNYTTNGYVGSSPAFFNGKVYIGSGDPSHGGDTKIYCLDADTGVEIWNYSTDGPVHSSPAIAYGMVYFGAWDGKLYCLDAETGIKIWDYPSGYSIPSPAVAYGNVYIGTEFNGMFCLNATDGTYIWSYSTGWDIDTSPAVADGKIYFGSDDNKMYCLNAYNGTWIWDYTTGNDIQSSPAIANGKVYVGSMDNNLYCFGVNQPPIFGEPTPANGSTDVPITISSLSVNIEDPEGDTFDWSIETSPDIGSSSGSGESYGSKTCDVSGLDYNTTYTWYVNATDSGGSGDWTREWFTFTTIEKPEPFYFVHITDTHIGSSREVRLGRFGVSFIGLFALNNFKQCINHINALNPKPEFIIISGDIVHYGDLPGLLGKLFSIKWYEKFNDILDSYNVIRYCCPGNHDYYRGFFGELGALDNYRAYIDVEYDSDNFRYNFTYSNTHFISINSGYDDGEISIPRQGSGLTPEDIDYLIEDLDSLDGKRDGKDSSGLNKIIFMHHPIINYGGVILKHWNHSVIVQNRAKFIDLCDTYRVNLVLTGHTHKNKIYKRSDDGNNVNGQSAPILCTETLYVQTADCKIHSAFRKITISGDEITVEEADVAH